MKTIQIIFPLMMLAKLCIAQQLKSNIDYQYYRDDKTYYAFELYKNTSSLDDNLMLNFVCSEVFQKINKIYLKDENNKVKLRFKERDEIIKADNREYKFYPISFNTKDLHLINLGGKTQIIFELDNGSVLKLPFNISKISDLFVKN